MPKKISKIIIHHSASGWGTVNDIRQWHIKRGWRDIGYHYVITNGIPTFEDYKNRRVLQYMIGQVEYGRLLDADPWLEAEEVGAHCYGFNQDSIGICLIHDVGQVYHPNMIISLHRMLAMMCLQFEIKIDNIFGHCELNPEKPDCPGLDMPGLRQIVSAEKQRMEEEAWS